MVSLMRQPTTKDFAEYFRLTLEAGVCLETEIETWADAMIIETTSPIPDWLLNLSIERETSKFKILESVPGIADEITVWNLVLAKLGVAVRAQKIDQERIVRQLFRWVVERVLPEDYTSMAFTLDDGYDGVQEGWFLLSQFEKDFAEFFRTFQVYEKWLPEFNLKA